MADMNLQLSIDLRKFSEGLKGAVSMAQTAKSHMENAFNGMKVNFSDLDRDLKQIEREVHNIGIEADKSEKELKKMEITTSQGSGSMVSKLGNIGMAVSGVYAAAQIAAATIGSFLSSTIEEAISAELGLAKVEQAVKSTGGAAGLSAEQIAKMASELEQIAAVDGDDIMNNISMPLLTFTNITKDIFPQAEIAILNMSRALGVDLQGAALQVGKALQDPMLGVNALRRAGVSFSEDQKQVIKALVDTGQVMEAQKLILAELDKEFGGQAEKFAGTYAGKIEAFKISWNNLKETLGTSLLPTLALFSEVIKTLLEKYVIPFTAEFAKFVAGIEAGFVMLYTMISNFVKAMATAINAPFQALSIIVPSILLSLREAISKFMSGDMKGAVSSLGTNIAESWRYAWDKANFEVRQGWDKLINDPKYKLITAQYSSFVGGSSTSSDGGGSAPKMQAPDFGRSSGSSKGDISESGADMTIARGQSQAEIDEKQKKAIEDQIRTLNLKKSTGLNVDQELLDSQTYYLEFLKKAYGVDSREYWVAVNDKIRMDEELRASQIKTWRDTHRVASAAIDAISQGVSGAFNTIFQSGMSMHEKLGAIWSSMKQSFLSIIGDMAAKWVKTKLTEVAMYVAGERTKQVATSTTNAIEKAGLLTTIALKLKSIAVTIGETIAVGFKWLISTLGPFGLGAAIALGAAIIAGFNGLRKTLGFRTGGYTGDGNDTDEAGVVHKKEFVFEAGIVKNNLSELMSLRKIMQTGKSLGEILQPAFVPVVPQMQPSYAGNYSREIIDELSSLRQELRNKKMQAVFHNDPVDPSALNKINRIGIRRTKEF